LLFGKDLSQIRSLQVYQHTELLVIQKESKKHHHSSSSFFCFLPKRGRVSVSSLQTLHSSTLLTLLHRKKNEKVPVFLQSFFSTLPLPSFSRSLTLSSTILGLFLYRVLTRICLKRRPGTGGSFRE
jgi:hypothetical protein